ncbi:MAG: infB [Phycisphaerales bacterium]|nr:infB [Phycisphaerales bacterium]
MAKGIRVNQLAKELGVESKAILAKCREEGLGEKVPNHMSVLSVGLAETVREWFSGGGGGGTAVEVAPPVEVKPKRSRVVVRKAVEGDEGDSLSPVTETAPEGRANHEPVAEAQPAPTESFIAPSVEEPVQRHEPHPATAPSAPPEAPAAPLTDDHTASPPSPAPMPVETPAHALKHPAAPAVPAAPPAAAVVAPPVHAPAPHAPVAHAPTHAPTTPHGPGYRPGGAVPPTARPTVSLKSMGGHGPATVERKSVTPAPQLGSDVARTPAKIQGPRVVREEKPEVVPVPGSRGPRTPRPGDAPAFTQARPQQGRGVKVTEEEDDAEARKKAAAAKAAGRTNSNRRRGPDGRRGEAQEKLREFSEADLAERRTRLAQAASHRAGVDRHMVKTQARGSHPLAKTGIQRGEPIEVEEPITVKGLSAALGVKANDIQGRMLRQGMPVSINQILDHETAQMIALEYGAELMIAQVETLEEELVGEFNARERSDDVLISRPAVVTILGHVDHGKTSLLDRIRKANVAAGEAGGITQHTAAWMVQVGEGDAAKRVTFIDTPGHQAFTSMRARGATMTDVVVLVVSAAEGVQPQTIESINHAKAAGVPIVVALNKIDRPDSNEPQVLGQLAANGLNPVEWGGDTEVIRTSAVTGQGIEELIEILDYQSQLLNLKTDPTAPARGTVIEARMDAGLGPVVTLLVQDGTLRPGDVVLGGPGYGRVRMLLNDRGESIKEATASVPVVVSGLNDLPAAGDKVYQVEDLDRAREIAEERENLNRQLSLAGRTQVTRDTLNDVIRAGETKTINLIIKGDVQGSVETLSKTVTDANTEEVKVKVIHAAVGGITESDVELAAATKANGGKVVIIGFHVVPEESARVQAEQYGVEIRLYRVIYEIFDDLKKALSGMLTPEIREKLHGHAEIRQVFKVSRVGNIAGCMVTDGHIQRGSKMRLSRGGIVITQDLAIETLRRAKDDVKEVKSGFECGIKLANYDDIKIGDVLEAYIREEIERTL